MTTQNDWKGITTLEAIHSILLTFVNALDHVKRGTMAEVEVLSKTRLVLNRYFEKRLADARREGFLEGEAHTLSFCDCDKCRNYKHLATLREDEETAAQMKHWGYGKGIEQTATKAEGSALTLDKLDES